jgi:hypothetical protein
MLRTKWGRFGLGYSIVVINKGDENIEGVLYVNSTTLTGEKILCSGGHFIIGPLFETGLQGIDLIDSHPFNLIFFTVVLEDVVVVTQSGYEIGPFVFLLKS